jgi:TATA-box binding protein (TBP) (component of TFIID and TFIIIB)
MEKHIPSVETRFYDLSGTSSVKLKEEVDLEKLASDLTDIDLEKYHPVAVKIYIDKELILTVFAAERGVTFETNNKVKVKKFKVAVEFHQLQKYIKNLQFTLVAEDGLRIENFEVIN